MNWKRFFIEQIRSHPQKMQAQDNIKRRISDLTARLQSPKTANTGGVTTGGDVSRYEEGMLSTIFEKGSLEKQYRNNAQDIRQIETALKVLTSEEKDIIGGLYFDHLSPDHLASKCNMSRSAIYNSRDRAIEKMMLYMFGTK